MNTLERLKLTRDIVDDLIDDLLQRIYNIDKAIYYLEENENSEQEFIKKEQ